MHARKAIIIGSGVAGMAAAIRLVIQGFEVHVYEANPYPGGKLSAFEQQGYKFDAGPSLFTQPDNVAALFALANEPIAEYLNYEPVDVACKYFYENGTIINGFSDKQELADELSRQVGENKQAVLKYLADGKKLYEDIGEVFLGHSLHKRKTWFHPRIVTAVKRLKFPYLFSTLHQYNKKRFTSAEAVQLFNRYATYNGSSPYKAPAMLSVIPQLEYNDGVYYPRGGMISITNALYKLAIKKGVAFHFSSPVQRIIQQSGKAAGVVVGNKNFFAPVVISNADVYFTYRNLLGMPSKAKQILKQERSSSALIFYWGINKQFSELGLHNIFFSGDYAAEFDCLFNKKSLYNDPTVYLNITSKMEPAQAPPGKENWFIMINVPANYGQDWALLKQQARALIIGKLNRLLKTDVEALIEMEETMDPIAIEGRTGSYMGSLYGTSSNAKTAAFLRPANFTNQVRGLYFCGGSVHPGGGIPLCLKSAKITTDIIVQDMKKQSH